MAPKKAAEAKLSRDEIVATARRLLAEVGVEGLTMRKLGDACGVKGPALYWHVKDKQELLGHILESVVGELDAGTDDQPWTERLAVLGRSLRTLMVAHPGIASVGAAGYSMTDRVLATIDTPVAALTAAGFSDSEALTIYFSVLTFTTGFVIYESTSPSFAVMATPVGSPERPAARERYEEMGGERFPHVTKAAVSFDELTVDEMFEQGLTALIQGWADRLAERR